MVDWCILHGIAYWLLFKGILYFILPLFYHFGHSEPTNEVLQPCCTNVYKYDQIWVYICICTITGTIYVGSLLCLLGSRGRMADVYIFYLYFVHISLSSLSIMKSMFFKDFSVQYQTILAQALAWVLWVLSFNIQAKKNS